VEQLLGRILRMPLAKKKSDPDLNVAYAYATSTNFAAAAQNLYDALVESGFDKFEAKQMVEQDGGQGSLPLFSQPVQQTAVSVQPDETPTLDTLPFDLRDRFAFNATTNTVTYTGPAPTDDDEQRAVASAGTEKQKRAVKKLLRNAAGRDASPAALGEQFTVPMLGVVVGGKLELFEEQFRDFEWKLSERDATLTEGEFSCVNEIDTVAVVDVSEQGRLYKSFVTELEQQLTLLELRGPGTPAELSVWLDAQFPHIDVTLLESQLFLSRVIRHLTDARGLTFEQLVQHRFRLREAVRKKVDYHRETATRRSYQEWLFGGQNEIAASPDLSFSFQADKYPASRLYSGPHKFNKHYYDRPADMNDEEVLCAILIDRSAKVKHWVRNVEQYPSLSFWLQTSTDKFYPDFLAELNDGSYAAVEYKGAHLRSTDDTKEKEDVGNLWATRSKGECAFRLVGKADQQAVLQALLY
jgi:type III restriction enzyme